MWGAQESEKGRLLTWLEARPDAARCDDIRRQTSTDGFFVVPCYLSTCLRVGQTEEVIRRTARVSVLGEYKVSLMVRRMRTCCIQTVVYYL